MEAADLEEEGTGDEEDESEESEEEEEEEGEESEEGGLSMPAQRTYDGPSEGESRQKTSESTQQEDGTPDISVLNISRESSRSASPEPDTVKDDIKARAAAEVSKRQNQQRRKYHSKKSVRNAGRPQGSKGKQDTRVKLDSFWA
jgi:RIO kinase 2